MKTRIIVFLLLKKLIVGTKAAHESEGGKYGVEKNIQRAMNCVMSSSVKCKVADTGKECNTLKLNKRANCKDTKFVFTFRFCSMEDESKIVLFNRPTQAKVYNTKVPGVKKFKKKIVKPKECRRKIFRTEFNPCDRRMIFASLKVEGIIPEEAEENYCYSWAWYSTEPQFIEPILKPPTAGPTSRPSFAPTVNTTDIPGLISEIECLVKGIVGSVDCGEFIDEVNENNGGRRRASSTEATRSLHSSIDTTGSRLKIEGLTSITNGSRDNEPIQINNYRVTINEVEKNLLAEGEVLILQPDETYSRSGFLDLFEYSGKTLDLEVYADGFGMESGDPVSTLSKLVFDFP